MKYSELIIKCIDLIESFDENLMTPDSHATEYLAKLKGCEDTEKVFMKQVFYGYERYKLFLKASNNIIFELYSTNTNRKNDFSLFAIFTYLICFRLDELPFNQFKKIILSQDMVKMNVLLTFIFDLDLLVEKVFPVWQEYLELDYLETKLYPKLVERKQKCMEILQKVTELATGKKYQSNMADTQQNIQDLKKKSTTIPQEFNLTKPKPKLIPELEKIEVGFKANPAPKAGKDLKKIELQKKERRKEIQDNIKKDYEESKKKQFDFETSKRPINLPKIKEEVQQLQTKELKKKITAKPMPKYNDVEVKLNVAAILREEKKLNEKIMEEEQRMKNLEINMRDDAEFQTWKKDMKEKDKYEELEIQQRRKIEMELTRQAAIKACQQNIEEKKSLVEDMREIAFQLKMEREKLEQQTLESKKKIIQEVQEIQENIKVEQEKIIQKNKIMHDELKEQRKRVNEMKKQEDKVEMQKKKQLIAEIRQLEKKIRAKPKQQIQYVSIGLLEELTLDQLRSRLIDVKKEQKEEEQRRRKENVKKKEEFKETISQKKDVIMAHREELAKQKQEEKRKKKEELEAEQKRLADVKIKSINQYKKKEEQKQQAKKVEKQKLAKEIKETDQRRMFLMQGQAQQEANAFMNLERGEERQILNRQNNKLVEEYKNQSIKEGEMRILADQNKKQVQKKIEFNQLYNETEEFNNRNAEELQQEDQATKAMKYHQVRTFENKHNENMAKTNPYKTKISQMSLSKAKKSSIKK